MSQPAYQKETCILREIATNPQRRIIWTKHAIDQMADRSILASDVENVLTKGQVVLHEWKSDLLLRVEGRDLDGNRLRVIAAVNEIAIEIKVVTAF